MNYSTFGQDVDVFKQLLEYITKVTEAGPLQPWEQPYFIKRFYTDTFKTKENCYIFKSDGTPVPKRFTNHTEPFRMVSKSANEGAMESAGYLQKFREFKTYELATATGMSFVEWLKMPPHITEAILNDCRRERRQIDKLREAERHKLEQATGASEEARLMQQMARGSKAL